MVSGWRCSRIDALEISPLRIDAAPSVDASGSMKSERGGVAKGVLDAWLYCLTFAEQTWRVISSGWVSDVHSPFQLFGSGPSGNGKVLW